MKRIKTTKSVTLPVASQQLNWVKIACIFNTNSIISNRIMYSYFPTHPFKQCTVFCFVFFCCCSPDECCQPNEALQGFFCFHFFLTLKAINIYKFWISINCGAEEIRNKSKVNFVSKGHYFRKWMKTDCAHIHKCYCTCGAVQCTDSKSCPDSLFDVFLSLSHNAAACETQPSHWCVDYRHVKPVWTYCTHAVTPVLFLNTSVCVETGVCRLQIYTSGSRAGGGSVVSAVTLQQLDCYFYFLWFLGVCMVSA